MKRKWLIGVPYKIPAGYRREFLFEDSVSGFRFRIVVDAKGIPVMNKGRVGGRAQSLCMDWIQESIERVRAEFGA